MVWRTESSASYRTTPFGRCTISALPGLRFGLGVLIRQIHATNYIVSEKELTIGRDHHDLQLIGKPLGHNFIDQKRIVL